MHAYIKNGLVKAASRWVLFECTGSDWLYAKVGPMTSTRLDLEGTRLAMIAFLLKFETQRNAHGPHTLESAV